MFTAHSQSRLDCDTRIHLVILVCASVKSLQRGLQSPINNVSAAITYSIGPLNIDVENDKLTLTPRFVLLRIKPHALCAQYRKISKILYTQLAVLLHYPKRTQSTAVIISWFYQRSDANSIGFLRISRERMG